MLTRIRSMYRRLRPYELSGCDPELAQRARELVAALREGGPPSWG